MATAPVFRATSGLNNVIEPHRLKYDKDGGCPLAEAVNIIIDDGGSFKRRYGRILKVEGPCHSLWSWGPYCFFVSEGALYRYYGNGTTVQVHASCGDLPMYFEEFGGKVYCSNGLFRAILSGNTISSWNATVPTQFASDTRTLGLPTSFTKICRHAGRMYLVDGAYLWESEPSNPGCVDLGAGYMTVGEGITDIISVRGGMYLSTATRTYFLSGSSKADFVLVDAHPSPIVPGTCAKIVADQVGDGGMVQGVAAIWTSRDGVCIGSEDGKVINVTSRRLAFDKASSGAGVVIPGQYFFSLEVE